MPSSNPDVVVLRGTAHGMSSERAARRLREHFPEKDVRLAGTPREERELVNAAPVATGLRLDPEVLANADSLRLFAAASAGVDHLPLDELAERGVAVTNASGVHAPNMAEQVLGDVLVFARNLHEGWRRQSNSEWRHFRGGELNGSTVTVVGMGPIGERTLELLAPFDVERVGVRYTPEKGGPADEVLGYDDDLHEVFSRSDYVVLACPLTDTTAGLVDEQVFRTLPPDAVVVNVARGGVVDTEALVAALRGNKIRGAALDVTDPEPLPEDHPLWTLENALVTPHNAGGTDEYWERHADILARNLERVDETGSYADLENQVVAPDD
ncbi:D-2-hydroxyacid dehydrogenase [Halobacterium sp. R2-5]|uniref:D-2-hydroxyacid dehydrogenase n=1 Tax=Halobacterium sp. R2-5 TaxID=2715751 RepID=UPI00142135B5|nr:D-2-hydroxyacid dehydrogenase [Halobacterium sp. R2-5]NIC00749.1 D-2-hydroxyacid dehydrogenase [Halobacterium sp. R2-5]